MSIPEIVNKPDPTRAVKGPKRCEGCLWRPASLTIPCRDVSYVCLDCACIFWAAVVKQGVHGAVYAAFDHAMQEMQHNGERK